MRDHDEDLDDAEDEELQFPPPQLLGGPTAVVRIASSASARGWVIIDRRDFDPATMAEYVNPPSAAP